MPETEEGKRAPRKIETQIQIIFPSHCTVFFGVLRVFFYIHKASKQFALHIVHSIIHTKILKKFRTLLLLDKS